MAQAQEQSHSTAGGSHAGHDHTAGANEKSLKIALGLTSSFLLVEFVGGIVTQSLALISDAAHMLTDVAALAIALVAIRIGKRAADSRRTFEDRRRHEQRPGDAGAQRSPRHLHCPPALGQHGGQHEAEPQNLGFAFLYNALASRSQQACCTRPPAGCSLP